MSSTANTIIRVRCPDCGGEGSTESYVYEPWREGLVSQCEWCCGDGFVEYKEMYDSMADARLDYPYATEILPVK